MLSTVLVIHVECSHLARFMLKDLQRLLCVVALSSTDEEVERGGGGSEYTEVRGTDQQESYPRWCLSHCGVDLPTVGYPG